MRVLHILPSLNFSGSATQLSLLAKHLSTEKVEQRVCALGGAGPMHSVLRAHGLAVDALNWRRSLNPLPLLRLRSLIRTWRPQVIHAWQMPSVRALTLAGKRVPCRWIVHGACNGHSKFTRLDSWLLRRATCVIAAGSAQADWLRARGLPQEKIVVAHPGVEESASALAVGERLNRRVVCAGSLERHKGYYDAIWAADILKYIFKDIHLDVIGDGPDRNRLERFVDAIHARDYVHLRGARAKAAEDLAAAGLVWVPSLRDGGVNVALEAMSLGKPVIASGVGTLGEIIRHEETGFLVPPGDKVSLARCTRLLFDDPNLRERFAAAGRERARTQFSAAKMADCFSQLYQHLAA